MEKTLHSLIKIFRFTHLYCGRIHTNLQDKIANPRGRNKLSTVNAKEIESAITHYHKITVTYKSCHSYASRQSSTIS